MEFNTLTTTLTTFVGVFQAGYSRLGPTINGLLAILAGIDIVLVGFWWALGGGERLTEVIKKILFLGFWLWFTKSFQSNAKAFVDSLINAGLTAGGHPGGVNLLLDPSRIAAYGLTATEQLAKALDDISVTDLGDVIIFGISYLLIMAAFLIMAIQAFLAVLEYYVILAVAGILIPWALLPQTKFLAEKAIGAVVSAGIKLMVLAFIIAVVDPVLASIHFSGPEIKLNELWSVLLTAAAIAFLTWHVPSLAAGLLAGSPSLSAAGVAQNVTSGSLLAAGVAGGMVAATRAAVSGASALGQRAAYGAGVLFGGGSKGTQQGGGAIDTALGAGTSAAASAGRSAVEGFKARLSRASAPFRDSFRAGAERSANVHRHEPPKT
ncbi:MAG TPA: P-type conjugative transfer protein TrbL [Acidothermaceae bacterium]